MKYLGTKVGNGLGIGKCYIVNEETLSIDDTILTSNWSLELDKVMTSVTELITEYEEKIKSSSQKDLTELLEFNKMILLAESLSLRIKELIIDKKCNGAYAIRTYFLERAEELSKVDNEYLKLRVLDIRDISDKLQRKFLNIKEFSLKDLSEDVILVSKEIKPYMLLSGDVKHVKGIISEIGGKTGHVGILSTSLGIPSVFGTKDISNILKNGEMLFIDGNAGVIETEISNEYKKEIDSMILRELELKKDLEAMSHKDAVTTDGVRFDVALNTGDISEVDKLDSFEFDGIGLFRSEFLYLNRNSEPSEDYLYEVYKKFVVKMKNKPVIIRTLDIGGDKTSSYIKIGDEENPFLGYRAIRYCLDNKDLFKTSLRAILRASANGTVMIMYPMISSKEEIESANVILEEAKEELRIENIKFDEFIKVGIMIEIPSVAVMAEQIVKYVDFYSIGTNDLVQYTLAVDRTNPTVSKLYNWFNPGVIRLIKTTIDATKKTKKFTGMCGEMAADPLSIILLVGLGLDEFSVNYSAILKTKKLISLLNKKEAEKIANKVLELTNVKDIEDLLVRHAKEKYGKYYS